MDIIIVLHETMNSDLSDELHEIDRLTRCETKDQIIAVVEDVVRDLESLTKKYQKMLARLKSGE